jgi:hypothetical protein
MPNRIIRESILDSDAVNSLTPEGEVFYRRLMSVVDDYGRFDARIAVLRSRLYPLQLEKVREASVERCLAECEAARLVRLYVAGDKQYLTFLKLGAPRSKESRWPAPPDEAALSASLRADENGCAQTRADVPGSYSGSGTGSNARARPDAGTRARAEIAVPEPPEAGGDEGDYERWKERMSILLGWTSQGQRQNFDGWVDGFRKRKYTPAELEAAADDIEARTEPLKWPNEVLPAINTSIKRQRAERSAAAKTAVLAGTTVSETERLQAIEEFRKKRTL